MSTAVAEKAGTGLDKEIEFTPFMSNDTIKLSVGMVKKWLCTPTRSGAVCTDQQALKFVMLCKARLLNPFEGDAYIVGFDSKDGPNFSLITAHQAFLKRAEVSKDFDGMRSGTIVMDGAGNTVEREGDFIFDDDKLLGAWATVYFKNKTHPCHKRVKFKTFDTGRSRWEKDPAGMIVKCAEADALRSSFPSQLGGMYAPEEMGVTDRPDGGHEYVPHETLVRPAGIENGKRVGKANALPSPQKSLPAPQPPAPETEVEPEEIQEVEPQPVRWQDRPIADFPRLGPEEVFNALAKLKIATCGQLNAKLGQKGGCDHTHLGITREQFADLSSVFADLCAEWSM